jgi:menaquinone-9 beta-reductase
LAIHTQICIIGAGPAGATTALFLAKAGIPHIIVDAAQFPRDKVCGDGLDLKVMRVLQHLDPNILTHDIQQNNGFSPSWGTRIITPNGKYVDLDYQPSTKEAQLPLYQVSRRAHFDHFLVQRFDPKYTDFRQNTTVQSLVREGNIWRINAENEGQHLEITCNLVIGADGDHSVVLRAIGDRKIERRHYAASQRQYWSGVTGMHPEGLIEFYFPKSLPWSYFWIFPLPNGEANVGFIMLSEPVAKLQINIRKELQRIITEDPVIAPRFKNATPLDKPAGWGLPLSSRRRKPFGDGFMLVGDAASLICPITGEGIGTSMLSGYLAAQFAIKAAEKEQYDASMFVGYEKELYRRLKDEILMGHLVYYLQKLPWKWSAWALNVVLPSRWLGYAFRRMAKGWLNTAVHKQIQIKHGVVPTTPPAKYS